MAFSVLADVFMGGGSAASAVWALSQTNPDDARALRMANAVVAGVLWRQHPQAVAEAESAISALLPNSVPLGVMFGWWPVVIVA
jgi:hypothetical protein